MMSQKVLVWHANDDVLRKNIAETKIHEHIASSENYRKIGDEAFKNNIRIRSMIFEKALRVVGRGSFYSCTALRKVDFGKIHIIERAAFYECSRLKKAILPGTVQRIGDRAFALCNHLDEVRISSESKWDRIGRETFAGCVELKQVTLPDGILEIGDRAFYRCKSLGEIILPEKVKFIGKESFYQCGLENVIFPESLETIDERAFYKCKNLQYVKIPDHIKMIGKGAFGGCTGLKTVEILHEPETIGEEIIPKSAKIRCRKGSKVDQYCRERGFSVEYQE